MIICTLSAVPANSMLVSRSRPATNNAKNKLRTRTPLVRYKEFKL